MEEACEVCSTLVPSANGENLQIRLTQESKGTIYRDVGRIMQNPRLVTAELLLSLDPKASGEGQVLDLEVSTV